MSGNNSGNLQEILKFLEAELAPPSLNLRPKRLQRIGLKKRSYAVGATIADTEARRRAVLLIVSGWVASGKELTDGTRTVVDFSLGGDIITIGSTSWAGETIRALSNVTLFEIPGAIYESLSMYPPHVPEYVLKGMARRYARIAERTVSISRRGAVERVAHLLLELAYRVGAPRSSGTASFPCPLTQADLGDALGLSVVHVNRVLRKLREGEYLSFRGGVVRFHDWKRVVDLADFDSAYLTLDSQ